jgi:uncharacterized protein YijF (DUF1287 family)
LIFLKRTFLLFPALLLALSLNAQSRQDSLAMAALKLTTHEVRYDPSYYAVDYPMGDIPADRGVCTDVVIRAYRMLGVDLQQLIHEDMKGNFNEYPNLWGLTSTDKNIDHRRVPNQMYFFERKGTTLALTLNEEDYLPGELVCWDLGNGTAHIGIVSSKTAENGQRYLIVHNIGNGQVLEDCLFDFKIIGHYKY